MEQELKSPEEIKVEYKSFNEEEEEIELENSEETRRTLKVENQKDENSSLNSFGSAKASDFESNSTDGSENFSLDSDQNKRINYLLENKGFSSKLDTSTIVFVQSFRDKKFERDFLEYFYGPKLTSLRIALLFASLLLVLVSVYDFFTFADGTTTPKFDLFELRIAFQVTRIIGASISVLTFILCQIPFVYKRKIFVEILIFILSTCVSSFAAFQAVVVTDRSLLITVSLCVYNLFRIRSFYFFISTILLFFSFIISSAFLEENKYLLSTSIVSVFIIISLQFILLYFYEDSFRSLFVTFSKLKEIDALLSGENEKRKLLIDNLFPKIIIPYVYKNEEHFEIIKDSSVMRLDIEDYTKFCAKSTPERIVSLLNTYYSAFDSICKRFEITKISTVGDEHISCVSNHFETGNRRIIFCGLEMIEEFKRINRYYNIDLSVRCGISAGTVLMTLTKSRRFDIFGDVVEAAHLCEASSTKNKVKISLPLKMKVNKYQNLFEFEEDKGSSVIGWFVQSKISKRKTMKYFKRVKKTKKKKNENDDSKHEKIDEESIGKKSETSEISEDSQTEKPEKPKKPKKEKNPLDKYKFSPIFLFFYNSFIENIFYYKQNYKNTQKLQVIVFFLFICLQGIALFNALMFKDFNYFFFIPIGITIFSIVCFFLYFIFRKIYIIGILISHFFGLIVSVVFIFTFYYVVISTGEQEITSKTTIFNIIDIFSLASPFLTFTWPAIHYYVKFFWVLSFNTVINLLMLFYNGNTATAFNFFNNLITTSVGFFFYHLSTYQQYKKQKEFVTEQKRLDKKIKENEQLMTSVLPVTICHDLLKKKNRTYQQVKDGICLFFAFRNTEKYNSYKPFIEAVFKVFDDFDVLIADNESSPVKIKQIGFRCIVVNGLNNKHNIASTKDHYMFQKNCMLELAKKMIRRCKKIMKKNGFDDIDIAIGIDAHEFTAGILGKTKFLFDVIGDSINLSARLSFCEDNKAILVSDRFKKNFSTNSSFFSEEKQIELKGKGKVDCYSVLIDVDERSE